MQLLFIGDSHANALARAIKRGGIKDITAIDVRRQAGTIERSKEIDRNLPDLYPSDAVFCCLGGTEYNLLGMIETDRRFDFLMSPTDPVAPQRAVLPRSLVRKALADKMRTALARMKTAHDLFSVPFFCVAPPPPFLDLHDEAQLPTAFQPLLKFGIAPASLRLKLYNLQNDIMQEHCGKSNIAFVPAPATSHDGDGYILEEYWDRDPTHGNAKYGGLVIDEMRRFANAQ